MRTLLSLLSLVVVVGTPAVQRNTQATQQRAVKQRIKGVPAPPVVERDIKVFTLENALAEDAVDTVSEIIPGVTLGVDPRTNSVIATGIAEELSILEAILLRLDEAKPKPAANEAEIRVFQLKADPSLVEQALGQLMPRDVRVVVDQQNNALIVSGVPSQIERVQKLVEFLDRPKPQVRPTKSLKLRVVWLMNDADGKEPGTELKPVIDSLGKIGISSLKLVTQSLVNVGEPQAQFDVVGSVGEEERAFEISGQRGDVTSNGAVRIDLRISAQPIGQKRPASMEAAVTLAPGQTAVLGVTQTRSANSAFVVQLIEGL